MTVTALAARAMEPSADVVPYERLSAPQAPKHARSAAESAAAEEGQRAIGLG